MARSFHCMLLWLCAVSGSYGSQAEAQYRAALADQASLFHWFGELPAEPIPTGLDAPLASDRPDFTEATSTVGRGVVQLEMGYTYIADREEGLSHHTHSGPELLLRTGLLAEWLELRVGWNMGQLDQTQPVNTFINGAEDLYLGLKIALTSQDGWLPAMALVPQMFVPTGSSELTSGELMPGLNWIYGWDVTEQWSIGGSTQGNRTLDGETGQGYLEIAQSLTSGVALTERLGGYLEWFAFFPHGADTVVPTHYLNGGMTFLLTENLQLDARVGMGLNRAADDYFTGAGLVIRF